MITSLCYFPFNSLPYSHQCKFLTTSWHVEDQLMLAIYACVWRQTFLPRKLPITTDAFFFFRNCLHPTSPQ